MSKFVTIIQDSSYRIKGLIDNMLDFASGHLGDGIVLNRETELSLADTLHQVIAELNMVWPDRTIEVHIDLHTPVNCDAKRIAQLFSNLLSNALIHGSPDKPVSIQAFCTNNEFNLSVANAGESIPVATIEQLFQPFSRGEIKPGQQGLGLGLYIAQEIARAHGGIIEASSTSLEIRFTLRFPLIA
jgi:signal transduction histidine kinase